MRALKANRQDLDGINSICAKYGIKTVAPEYINSKDLSLVAKDGNKVVGFIWCGILCQGTKGYIDCFVVDPEYQGMGVGQLLAHKLLKVALKKGVRETFGIIAHGAYHDNSAMNALKMAMMAAPKTYTYVYADVTNTVNELKGANSQWVDQVEKQSA